MLIWIFFESGVGGDGFANLLEHSDNSVSIDNLKQWRIHRYVNNQVKFWAPNLQQTSDRINLAQQLEPWQLDLLHNQHQHMIVTSHDIRMETTFQGQETVKSQAIKVLLLSKNMDKILENYRIKNLVNVSLETLKSLHRKIPKIDEMDHVIYIEDILSNWNTVKDFTESLGLVLDQQHYEHYKNIVSGKIKYTTPGIEYYESTVDQNNNTIYTKVN